MVEMCIQHLFINGDSLHIWWNRFFFFPCTYNRYIYVQFWTCFFFGDKIKYYFSYICILIFTPSHIYFYLLLWLWEETASGSDVPYNVTLHHVWYIFFSYVCWKTFSYGLISFFRFSWRFRTKTSRRICLHLLSVSLYGIIQTNKIPLPE